MRLLRRHRAGQLDHPPSRWGWIGFVAVDHADAATPLQFLWATRLRAALAPDPQK